MIATLTLFWSVVVWAIWRRMFGGWLGRSRVMLVVSAGMMTAAAFATSEMLVAFGYFLVTAWPALVAVAITLLFWTPGHNFESDRALALRYGPVGLAWIIARRLWPRSKSWPPFLDGWTAAAELLAGAIFGLIFGAILLLTK